MSVLEDQEDAVVIVEPAVEAEDVGVAEAGLDLHLPPQLVLNLVLLDLLLEYYLQCHYVLALPNNKNPNFPRNQINRWIRIRGFSI